MTTDATKYSPELIAETKQVWQPHYPDPLSAQDAIDIIDNTIALLELLNELDQTNGKA